MFDRKTLTQKLFWYKSRSKLKKAQLGSIFAPVPPANQSNDQIELDRVATAQKANQPVLKNAVNDRNRTIKKPHKFHAQFHRKKFVGPIKAAAVQISYRVVRQQMFSFELCPSGGRSIDAFNEDNRTRSEKLLRALLKPTGQQKELKQQQTGRSNRTNTLKISQPTNQYYERSHQSQYCRIKQHIQQLRKIPRK